jgi:hypothetical protein
MRDQYSPSKTTGLRHHGKYGSAGTRGVAVLRQAGHRGTVVVELIPVSLNLHLDIQWALPELKKLLLWKADPKFVIR